MALAKTSAYPRQGDFRPFFPDGTDTERDEFSPFFSLFPTFPPCVAALGTVWLLFSPPEGSLARRGC